MHLRHSLQSASLAVLIFLCLVKIAVCDCPLTVYPASTSIGFIHAVIEPGTEPLSEPLTYHYSLRKPFTNMTGVQISSAINAISMEELSEELGFNITTQVLTLSELKFSIFLL